MRCVNCDSRPNKKAKICSDYQLPDSKQWSSVEAEISSAIIRPAERRNLSGGDKRDRQFPVSAVVSTSVHHMMYFNHTKALVINEVHRMVIATSIHTYEMHVRLAEMWVIVLQGEALQPEGHV